MSVLQESVLGSVLCNNFHDDVEGIEVAEYYEVVAYTDDLVLIVAEIELLKPKMEVPIKRIGR